MDSSISTTAELYLTISGLFFGSALISRLLANKKTGRAGMLTAILFVATGVGYFYIKAVGEDTRYKDFGVFRYSKTHEIKSRYRTLSRQVHPDVSRGAEDQGFENLSDKLEFLTDRTTREFYDKYDFAFKNRDQNDKELKEVQSALFQLKFYKLVNVSFLWICILFFLSTLTRTQRLINTMLKFVVLKTFIQIFYVYTQPVEEKSIFDSLFPYLTIHLQVLYVDYFFSIVMGLIWNVLFNRYADRVQEDKALIDVIQTKSEGFKASSEEAHAKLKTELDALKELF